MSVSSLEILVDDLANIAQIHGRIFEEISKVGDGVAPNYIMNFQTYAMLSFLVGEMCGRTIKLQKDYGEALDAELGARP